ncbi:TPA: hypothetical protein ACF754_002808 [Legionella pneumophila]|nr:hypothetical protein [Legionella pneumophila]MDF1930056.1 hypothetical protein [Legionella pneumophila]
MQKHSAGAVKQLINAGSIIDFMSKVLSQYDSQLAPLDVVVQT